MDEIIAEITKVLKSIEDGAKDLGDTISSLLSSAADLLGDGVDKVVEGWNWFLRKMEEFWAWIKNVVAHVGDPSALRAASISWVDDVGSAVSSFTKDLGSSQRPVKNTWVGDASVRYADHIEDQKTALKSVDEGFTTAVSGALDSVAQGITDYWWKCGVGVAEVVVGFILAEGAAMSIIGLPAVPAAAWGAIALFMVTVSQAGDNLTGVVDAASRAMNSAADGDPWPVFAVA